MGFFSNLTNGISSTWNDTTSVIGNVTSGIGNEVGSIGSQIESKWNDLTDSDITGKIETKIESGWGKIESGWNTTIDWFNDKIPSLDWSKWLKYIVIIAVVYILLFTPFG